MIVVRNIPVAPFTVVNLVAGASKIHFRDYLLGTVIGMAPGIAALTIFMDRLEQAVRNPAVENFLVLVGVAVVISAGALLLRKWLVGRTSPPARSEKH
jgi:phospholipase D1/2